MAEPVAAYLGGEHLIHPCILLAHAVFDIQVNEVQHDLRVRGIKLRPHALDQLLAHLLLGDRVAVAALGCHGVVCVSHRNDPRDLGDVFALQPLGISPAVESLVVVVRPDAQVRGLLDSGEDLVPVNRVELDLGVLLVGQLAILVDDGVGDADLAYVVQQRREIHFLAILVRFARLPGDPGGILGYAVRVAVGTPVLGVDSGRQRLRRLFEQVVQLLLLFLIVFDLQVPRTIHLAVHILERQHIQQRRHGNDRHVVE